MPTLFIVLGGLLFSIIAHQYFPLPYIFIATCWLAICATFFWKSQTALGKGVWFNLAFTVLVLSAVEVYSLLSLKAQEKLGSSRYQGGYTDSYFTSNQILGYGATPNVAKTSQKIHENQVVYEVTYTIGVDGNRITPPGEILGSNECIVFFGDSFTIGEGVNDHESLPFIVGTLQPYKVRNFGFHGYGPHQMLAAIESGLVDCKPRFAIFQTMGEHVARSAGYASWDRHGPRYVLRDGRLVDDGHFDDSKEVVSPKKEMIEIELEKSYFYRKFLHSRPKVADDDIELYLQIVDTARRKLSEQFPGIAFYVILWDKEPNDRTFLRIKEGFESLSIKFNLASDMLPGLSENLEKYEISIYDGHPNPETHEMIAEYIVNNILF